MSGLAERAYLAAPLWVQQAGVAAYGWWWQRRRFGAHFQRTVEELGEHEGWSRARHTEEQGRLLGAVLAAAAKSPYWSAVLRAAGVDAHTEPFAALARLPVTTKQALRTRGRELLAGPPPRGTRRFRSSGSTGTPTELYYTEAFHQEVQAFFEVRVRGWAGVDHRQRRVMFGVRKVCRAEQDGPPFWRYSPAENLAYASVFHLAPQFLGAYVEFLQEWQPRVVMGFASAMAVVARFALEQGRALPPAAAVITTGETLGEATRAVLERAWGCRVHDAYSSVEACILASQCAHGRYHASPEIGLLEVLDGEGRPCAPGQVGRAVCTGLRNHLQPLLRYELGDALAWSAESECPCGRGLPLLAGIEGRLEDLCVTPDGRRLARFDPVFKGVAGIREAQVVQEARDHFVLRVVPDAGFGEAQRRELLRNLARQVGEVRAEVVLTGALERTPAGKLRSVVSRVQ